MSDGPVDSLRIDKWLWYARFCKTRSLASAFVKSGAVRVNRQSVSKPNHAVRPGDVLTFAQGERVCVVQVVALGERRGPAPEARTLYEDLSPPPPPREARPAVAGLREPGAGRPTKRERREIDRFTGR